MSSFITYEQPLNENIRLCLRLESLFNQFKGFLKVDGVMHHRLALDCLLKIIDVSDRPELKSKMIQALHQQAQALAQLGNNQSVDRDKLHQLLQQLERLALALERSGRLKIGETLRQHPFLKQIRLQANNPGGIAEFNAPAYAAWLHQNDERRRRDLNLWKKEFELLDSVVALLLGITREGAEPARVMAHKAFYQQALDPQAINQMVRVTLPANWQLYPEISVGRHRLAIRFRSLFAEAYDDNGDRVPAELPFQIHCCKLLTKHSEELAYL